MIIVGNEKKKSLIVIWIVKGVHKYYGFWGKQESYCLKNCTIWGLTSLVTVTQCLKVARCVTLSSL